MILIVFALTSPLLFFLLCNENQRSEKVFILDEQLIDHNIVLPLVISVVPLPSTTKAFTTIRLFLYPFVNIITYIYNLRLCNSFSSISIRSSCKFNFLAFSYDTISN